MKYSVNELAKLSGISSRTLRYYDEIDLLKPARSDSNNYRIYGEEQLDMLQQILFYRELGLSLDEIRNIIRDPNFNKEKALESHLSELLKRKEQINLLIKNVSNTIASMKGEIAMSDKKKFEGFKQNLIDENEKKYGKEIRQKYGDKVVDDTNAKFKGMSEEKYASVEKLTETLNNTLAEAFKTGDPGGELAQKACELHKEWLNCYWPEGLYSKEAHLALVQGYVDDPRFTAYYDKIAPGSAVFLRDAMNIYYGKRF